MIQLMIFSVSKKKYLHLSPSGLSCLLVVMFLVARSGCQFTARALLSSPTALCPVHVIEFA